MRDDELDQTTLKQDADISAPLERVNYAAGMLLGLEAARDEQDYHRRRLNRLQYWLHGAGTVAGMAVSLDAPAGEDGGSMRIQVFPGVGVDALGREIMVPETYCLSLNDWIESQSAEELTKGFDETNENLWLSVTIRQLACGVGLQPVLAERLNAGTDAVDYGRNKESILIEIGVDERRGADDFSNLSSGWRESILSRSDAGSLLSDDETEYLENQSPDSRADLQLRNRLIQSFSGGLPNMKNEPDILDVARIPLAQIRIHASSVEDISVTPENVSVNNLKRPFVPGWKRFIAAD